MFKIVISSNSDNLIAKRKALVAESFVECGTSESGLKIVLRRSRSSVNHLYEMEDGSRADIVIGYNEELNDITVSRFDDSVPFMAQKFVQGLWGNMAGGHAGIARSPRDTELKFLEAEYAYEVALRIYTNGT